MQEMVEEEKKSTSCLEWVLAAVVLIGGCGYMLYSGNQARKRAVDDVSRQLRKGASVLNFVPPDVSRIFVDYRGETSRECVHFRSSVSKLHLEIDKKKKDITRASQLPKFLHDHRESVLECNEISVTIFGGRTPVRTTAKFKYNAEGIVTDSEAPYTWD